ncbi:hypothetical protein CBS101457_000204 [Exobasidium rhododendri]|nr:hypothetical protein CBS101457_000204 [Exobasidium rhododendri]
MDGSERYDNVNPSTFHPGPIRTSSSAAEPYHDTVSGAQTSRLDRVTNAALDAGARTSRLGTTRRRSTRANPRSLEQGSSSSPHQSTASHNVDVAHAWMNDLPPIAGSSTNYDYSDGAPLPYTAHPLYPDTYASLLHPTGSFGYEHQGDATGYLGTQYIAPYSGSVSHPATQRDDHLLNIDINSAHLAPMGGQYEAYVSPGTIHSDQTGSLNVSSIYNHDLNVPLQDWGNMYGGADAYMDPGSSSTTDFPHQHEGYELPSAPGNVDHQAIPPLENAVHTCEDLRLYTGEYTLRYDPIVRHNESDDRVYKTLDTDQRLIVIERIHRVRPFTRRAIRLHLARVLRSDRAEDLLSNEIPRVKAATEALYPINRQKRNSKRIAWMTNLNENQRLEVIQRLKEATGQSPSHLRDEMALREEIGPDSAYDILHSSPNQSHAIAARLGLLVPDSTTTLPWQSGLTQLQRKALLQRMMLHGVNKEATCYNQLAMAKVTEGYGLKMLTASDDDFQSVIFAFQRGYDLPDLQDARPIYYTRH